MNNIFIKRTKFYLKDLVENEITKSCEYFAILTFENSKICFVHRIYLYSHRTKTLHKMEKNQKNQQLNRQWTQPETIKLIRNLSNFQLLWVPKIFEQEKYRPIIRVAMKRLVDLTDRRWREIQRKILKLRFNYIKCLKGKLRSQYYIEMKRSLTHGNKV